jgi:predicted enzyme related to lactoylglutathione lyase
MELELRNVVIDCNDLERMGAFWSGLTGYRIKWTVSNYSVLQHDDGRSPGLLLQKVGEAAKEKNRLHLDFHCPDAIQAIARAEALGATFIEQRSQHGITWNVLQDPEGNFFCIAAGG